ncbi:protein G12 [Monomorium pharaonis]|uniref:protein G12 n=1 Tax=Monomorium pharaonis TaxID=307658 RepID=UPI00174675DC|nr:protein G12 [Monomorium pharaonis]
MKYALVLLAFVAAASAKIEIPNFGRGELHKEIQDFLDLVPAEQIFDLTVEYYIQDAEFQNMVKYFQSEGFKQLVIDVEALPEIKQLMNYIHDAGIDIYKIVNIMNNALGIPPLTPPSYAMGPHITGGIRGYVDDVLALLPMKQLQDLYDQKLATSKAFAEFIAQLESDNFQQIVNTVYAHPKFQELLAHARTAGIDLILIKNLLEVLWGIKVPSY